MRFFFGDEIAEEVKSYKDIGKICDHWLLIKHCDNDVLLISSAQYVSDVTNKGALNMIIGYLKFCGFKESEQLTKINDRYHEINRVAEELSDCYEKIKKIIKVSIETSSKIDEKILEIKKEISFLGANARQVLKEKNIKDWAIFSKANLNTWPLENYVWDDLRNLLS